VRGARAALGMIVAALTIGGWACAADTWGYSYKDFEIMAEGSANDALTVGRQLGAMDESMRALLHLSSVASEPPTRVYVLPQAQLAPLDAVWSSEGGGFFRTGPFDDYVVLPNGPLSANAEVYEQRARALLASWGLGRLPEWYRQGIALLMADARVEHDQLIVGQDLRERSERIAHNWIPMAQFLQLAANDPTLHRSPDTEATYEAQCWWLAHLTLLDTVLDKVMPQYLQRLLMGESQQQAYAATFGIPYEQLDQYFRKLRGKIVLKRYTAALPDPVVLTNPPLTTVQVQSRLAELLLAHEPQAASATQMAKDVLSQEPKNERALLTLAGQDFAARRYGAVQERLAELGISEELSAASHRALGTLQAGLAKARDENMPGSSGVDARGMRAAARTHLKRAMDLDPNDPRAPFQLGWMLSTAGDVVGVRELLPKVEAAFYRRPESADLAELLVRMHTLAGNTADVFKYAVAEQRLAATDADRARATARVERLRTQLKAPQ